MSDDLIKRSDAIKAVLWGNGLDGSVVDDICEKIDAIPTTDRPQGELVRCQDCKYWVYNFNGCARNPCTEPWYATDFCNYGEREGE